MYSCTFYSIFVYMTY